MPRSARRASGRRVPAAPSRRPGSGNVLDRILNTPHLARVVPRLPPELVHRIIQHCGLEDCGDLIGLITPTQLAHVFDQDLWSGVNAGGDDRLDADRFGVWLDVLVESGAPSAAATIAAMDQELVIAALGQHIRVFDYAAVAPFTTLDGEEAAAGRALEEQQRFEVGGYVVVPRRQGPWEAITTVLVHLDEAHHDRFAAIMQGCRELSNAPREIDGLDELLTPDGQVTFEASIAREHRLGTQGYVPAAQARAFLELARRVDLRAGSSCPVNAIATSYLRSLASDAIAESRDDSRETSAGGESTDAPTDARDDISAVVEVLIEAGVMPESQRPVAQLPPGDAPEAMRLQTYLQFAQDVDADACARRNMELAFLANAITAGSSIQSRPLTSAEASAAVEAVCNLGLENWPAAWRAPHPRTGAVIAIVDALPHDFLVDQDLVDVFQVGWTVLHENVSMQTAASLVDALASLRCHDQVLQSGLDELRVVLTKYWRAGTPWRARDALDVISSLDMLTWAALLGLLDECPVMHGAIAASLTAGVREVDAAAFQFVSCNRQIATIHKFLQQLPERLI